MPLKSWIVTALMLALIACTDERPARDFEFAHGPNSLAGSLFLPEGEGPHPLILLVHGDGALPRDAFGYYRPFIEALNAVGYAVASWDKPGVGASSGDWLDQTMSDRADEVTHAIDALAQQDGLDMRIVGVMGFSQAGWVMPEAILRDDRIDFMIAASTAINWREQSRYAREMRLRAAGLSEAEIDEALAHLQQIDDLLVHHAGYAAYQVAMSSAPDCCDDLMSPARWRFALNNHDSDVRDQLAELDVPVLALLGDYDLNVDTRQTAHDYRVLLGEDAPLTVMVARHADHSLLPAPQPRYVTGDNAMIGRLLMVDLRGEAAFAQGVFPVLRAWATAQLIAQEASSSVPAGGEEDA